MTTVFALVGLGVLVYDHFGRLNPLAIVLARPSIAAVIVRLVLTFRENMQCSPRAATRR